MIARTEVALAVARESAFAVDLIGDSPAAMQIRDFSVLLVDVDVEVAKAAAELGAAHRLRALDAIHVATAIQFRPTLTEVVTYDRRMADACRALALPVVSPGA